MRPEAIVDTCSCFGEDALGYPAIMTLSTIDLTRRLDDLERQLPPIPAKSMAFGRAAVRLTNDVVTSVVSDVARRVDRVVTTARTGASTTAGQARSATERTATTAQTGLDQTAGQARSAAGRTAKAAKSAAKEAAGQARSAAERTAATARESAKQTAGQARAQAKRTRDRAERETEGLIDDAVEAVESNGRRRGVPYEEWTKDELYERAQELDLDGRSSMTKQQLVDALRSS